jgi:NADH:ubiquinone oxidoreductase subunit D
MEYYERACGSRLHANYIRPGGVSCDVGIELINDIDIFCKQFGKRVDEIEEVLSKNRI